MLFLGAPVPGMRGKCARSGLLPVPDLVDQDGELFVVELMDEFRDPVRIEKLIALGRAGGAGADGSGKDGAVQNGIALHPADDIVVDQFDSDGPEHAFDLLCQDHIVCGGGGVAAGVVVQEDYPGCAKLERGLHH